MVGTLEPRKNADVVFDAFERWRALERQSDCELVLVGEAGWRDKSLRAHLSSVSGGIRALGRVPDDELPALYAGAVALVFVSRYEGFGLPVLEARACGGTVIASDVPEIREAGGEEAIYVSPDVQALVTALSRAWRHQRPGRGVERSALPSWRETGAVVASYLRL
jgi:glycosyltransferase involved in cell wall biosynthesis